MVLIFRGPYSFFFFNDTATTEIYPLSLHDALPILDRPPAPARRIPRPWLRIHPRRLRPDPRSEEHTSELQSLAYLVCRLLLEKKNGERRGRRDRGRAARAVPARRGPGNRRHLFFFSGYGDHRDLHSFPTRRSSDLRRLRPDPRLRGRPLGRFLKARPGRRRRHAALGRSEEHTSELQSLAYLVCR